MAYGTTRVHDEPDGDIRAGATAGYTPLMRAAVLGRKDVVEVLLQHGAHPKLKLKRPTMLTIIDDHFEGADNALIRPVEEKEEEAEEKETNGSDEDDEVGLNAAELARKHGHDGIAKEIENHF
jgi:ankyrin repeat protein